MCDIALRLRASLQGASSFIPALAAARGIKVLQGAWLTEDAAANAVQYWGAKFLALAFPDTGAHNDIAALVVRLRRGTGARPTGNQYPLTLRHLAVVAVVCGFNMRQRMGVGVAEGAITDCIRRDSTAQLAETAVPASCVSTAALITCSPVLQQPQRRGRAATDRLRGVLGQLVQRGCAR